jgi:hypothetical protein
VIAEAVDTLRTLGWALAAWIVLLSLAGALALHTALVAAVWPCRTAWEALDAALAASQALRALREHPAPERASQTRTAPRVPSWARTDKDAA